MSNLPTLTTKTSLTLTEGAGSTLAQISPEESQGLEKLRESWKKVIDNSSYHPSYHELSTAEKAELELAHEAYAAYNRSMETIEQALHEEICLLEVAFLEEPTDDDLEQKIRLAVQLYGLSEQLHLSQARKRIEFLLRYVSIRQQSKPEIEEADTNDFNFLNYRLRLLIDTVGESQRKLRRGEIYKQSQIQALKLAEQYRRNGEQELAEACLDIQKNLERCFD